MDATLTTDNMDGIQLTGSSVSTGGAAASGVSSAASTPLGDAVITVGEPSERLSAAPSSAASTPTTPVGERTKNGGLSVHDAQNAVAEDEIATGLQQMSQEDFDREMEMWTRYPGDLEVALQDMSARMAMVARAEEAFEEALRRGWRDFDEEFMEIYLEGWNQAIGRIPVPSPANHFGKDFDPEFRAEQAQGQQSEDDDVPVRKSTKRKTPPTSAKSASPDDASYTVVTAKTPGRDQGRDAPYSAKERADLTEKFRAPAVVIKGRRRNDRIEKRDADKTAQSEAAASAKKKRAPRKQLTQAEWLEMYPRMDEPWPKEYHTPAEVMHIAKANMKGDPPQPGFARGKPAGYKRHEAAPEAFTYRGFLRHAWLPWRKMVDQKSGKQILTDAELAKICAKQDAKHEVARWIFNAKGFVYTRAPPAIEAPRDQRTGQFVLKRPDNVKFSEQSKAKLLAASLTEERGYFNLMDVNSNELGTKKMSVLKDELIRDRAQASIEIARTIDAQEKEAQFVRDEVKRVTAKHKVQVTKLNEEHAAEVAELEEKMKEMALKMREVESENEFLLGRVADLEDVLEEYEFAAGTPAEQEDSST